MTEEFRVVIQIEQLDEQGQVLCTYGPPPVTILRTDDAEEAIAEFERVSWQNEEEL